MANTWGRKLKLSIFGESHGKAIGIVIDGLPPGEVISQSGIEAEMLRRAPGRDAFSTARSEADKVEVLAGLFDGMTTGMPVCGVINNSDARSKDYNSLLRPGHADWTAMLKYKGFADMRGGGHFSGRLTAPVVFAGSIARQILARKGVMVYSKICAIGGETDITNERMREIILAAKAEGDSVGGVVEVTATGVPAGLGSPFFESMESEIASMLFSIPAVKGVEFGDGFALSAKKGSESNDEMYMNDGTISAYTNHNGGILGGITNGMPLVVRVAVKPTPSIATEQRTVDSSAMTDAVISTGGRHDPCIVFRALPVFEAALAICILDATLFEGAI